MKLNKLNIYKLEKIPELKCIFINSINIDEDWRVTIPIYLPFPIKPMENMLKRKRNIVQGEILLGFVEEMFMNKGNIDRSTLELCDFHIKKKGNDIELYIKSNLGRESYFKSKHFGITSFGTSLVDEDFLEDLPENYHKYWTNLKTNI